MALTDKKSSGIGILLVIALFVIILIIGFIVSGVNGIFAVFKTVLIISFVVAFLGFVFYIIYYLFFKKHRVDLTYENWKDYVKSGTDNGPDMMEDLVLYGDKHHSTKRFMTIKGYLRIKGFDNKQYDMFIGKRSPNNPFEDYKVVMLQPEQHSDLIGDVYVYGISLIMKYGYYFLNNEILNYDAIDNFVSKDTFRSVIYTTLGDMKGIVDRATGMDPEEIKNRANQKLLKIPMLSGQEQSTPKQ